MCLCDSQGKFECFVFDHDRGNCSSTEYYCLNGGVCRHTSLGVTKDPFLCACPVCYYGSLCQFTTTQYTISLDAFEINSYLFICICVVSFIGIIANSFSIDVFFRRKSCQVGSGFYLRVLSLVGQVNLLLFLLKMCQIYLQWSNHLVICLVVEYLLGTLPSIFDWLAACVAIERLIGVIKKSQFNQAKSRRASKWVIPLVIFVVLGTSIHEVFYREIIKDPKRTEQSWCIVNYPRHFHAINLSRKIFNLIHLISPFLISFGSSILLLALTIQRKYSLQTNNQKSQDKACLKLFRRELSLIKHSLISPCLLVLFGLPRLILTFAFACIEHSWQEKFYMISYLISIIPMTAVLFIFVFPSTVYFKMFKQHRLIRLFSVYRQ